jgi:hypothetical protein
MLRLPPDGITLVRNPFKVRGYFAWQIPLAIGRFWLGLSGRWLDQQQNTKQPRQTNQPTNALILQGYHRCTLDLSCVRQRV